MSGPPGLSGIRLTPCRHANATAPFAAWIKIDDVFVDGVYVSWAIIEVLVDGHWIPLKMGGERDVVIGCGAVALSLLAIWAAVMLIERAVLAVVEVVVWFVGLCER